MSDKHFVGLEFISFDKNGAQKPISRITLVADDETSYTAGDDTGREVKADCPSATQEMVEAILLNLQGYQYKGFEAGAASLDPAAELGDGVTVGGIYSVLASQNDDGRGYPDIAAPGEEELTEEYPYLGPVQKKVEEAVKISGEVQKTLSGWVYEGTTFINGEMIMTGTVRASVLEGGEIRLLDSEANTAGTISLAGAASYDGQKITIESGAISLDCMHGDFYASSGKGTYIHVTDTIFAGNADFASNLNNTHSCGTSDRTWTDVYAANATIQTSDLTKKKEVVYGLEAYDKFFDGLKPMSYLLADGNSGRRHLGLGAQDVEALLSEVGLTSMDFAGFIKSPNKEKYDYALRYGEFISLCIEQIQKLKERVKKLEGLS